LGLSIGQQAILEREVNRTYDVVSLMCLVLRARHEVFDVSSVRALSEGLKKLAEDVQADRARASQLSESDVASVSVVQQAVFRTFVESIPPLSETSTMKPIYEAAARAIRRLWES
jgi:hypothetical protein